MYELKLDGIKQLDSDEFNELDKSVYKEKSKDYHYLAFDKKINGFSPLGTYVRGCKKILDNEKSIVKALIESGEVCSLYPVMNLTMYPLYNYEGGMEFEVDTVNIEKHFKDILELNDNILKTPYLYVIFSVDMKNLDIELMHKHLRWLLKNSKVLKKVFIEK